jgi:hypothetical protein
MDLNSVYSFIQSGYSISEMNWYSIYFLPSPLQCIWYWLIWLLVNMENQYIVTVFLQWIDSQSVNLFFA